MPQKPKSNEFKKLDGTFRADRATKGPQGVAFSVPMMPTWLSETAKATWRYHIAELKRTKNVSRLDRDALAMLCTLFARIVQSERDGGDLSPGLVGHYIKLAMQFGLTPGSRAVAAPVEPSTPVESKWLAFQRKSIVANAE
jgi:phage terminase small subunit